jgi:hypothetical protein
LKKTIERVVSRAYEAKLRERERQAKIASEAAINRARADERRRNERLLERLRKQNEEERRRFERLGADERGVVGEVQILEVLQRAFPGDVITRLSKNRGSADISHDVREHGRSCGLIVYECKNVARWANSAVAQARGSLSVHRATQAVVVTNVFPAQQKYLAF